MTKTAEGMTDPGPGGLTSAQARRIVADIDAMTVERVLGDMIGRAVHRVR